MSSSCYLQVYDVSCDDTDVLKICNLGLYFHGHYVKLHFIIFILWWLYIEMLMLSLPNFLKTSTHSSFCDCDLFCWTISESCIQPKEILLRHQVITGTQRSFQTEVCRPIFLDFVWSLSLPTSCVEDRALKQAVTTCPSGHVLCQNG